MNEVLVTAIKNEFPGAPSALTLRGIVRYVISLKPKEDVTSKEDFYAWTVRYGPWKGLLNRTVASVIDDDGLVYSWFQGCLSSSKAGALLQKKNKEGKPPAVGSYLVRYSERYNDRLALCFTKKKGGNTVVKTMLCHNVNGKFTFHPEEDDASLRHDNVVEALRQVCKEQEYLNFESPVKGKPRKAMYAAKKEADKYADAPTKGNSTYEQLDGAAGAGGAPAHAGNSAYSALDMGGAGGGDAGAAPGGGGGAYGMFDAGADGDANPAGQSSYSTFDG